jgi:hypothetical protein
MSDHYFGSWGSTMSAGVESHTRRKIPYSGKITHVSVRAIGPASKGAIGSIALLDEASGSYTIKTMREGQKFGGYIDYAHWDADITVVQGQYLQFYIWSDTDGEYYVTYEMEI